MKIPTLVSRMPHFGQNKSKTVPLNYFFNDCHQLLLQKSLMNRFREKFKSVDSGSKEWAIPPILGKMRIFLEDQKLPLLLIFFFFHQVKFKKNLRSRFREKIKNVDFGPQNDLFALILGIVRIFIKMQNSHFYLHLMPVIR